jgi:hypothetical protein
VEIEKEVEVPFLKPDGTMALNPDGTAKKKKEFQKIPKMVNGGFQYINNRQQYLEETYQFVNLQSSMQHGFLSAFYVYDDTPKEVVDRLKQLDEDRGCLVENREKYESSINPAEYKEKKEKEAINEKLEDLKKKYEAAQNQIAILEKMKQNVRKIETKEA